VCGAQAEQFASADADRKAKVDAQNEADSTVYSTEKTLLEHKDKIPQEDRELIQADIEQVKAAVANDAVSAEQLKEKVEALKRSSMKIGEAMYKNAGSAGSEDGDRAAEYEEMRKDGSGKPGDRGDTEQK